MTVVSALDPLRPAEVDFDDFRAEFSSFRSEMRSEFSEIRSEIRTEMREINVAMREQLRIYSTITIGSLTALTAIFSLVVTMIV